MSNKSYDEWVDKVRDRCENCQFLDEEWVCGALHKSITEIQICGIDDKRKEDERGERK